MANIETNMSVPFGAISTYRIVNVFDEAFATVRAWNAAHRTTRALNALSDYQLDDIGLTRGDIADVRQFINFR